MEVKRQNLIALIAQAHDEGKQPSETIAKIKGDIDMVSASNSYCAQCGNCCNSRCANIEHRSGLAFCLLHHPEEEDNLPRADYDALYHKLDPTEWSKPPVCHTYGPHVVVFALIEYEKKDMSIFLRTLDRCKGSRAMFRDYKAFLEERESST